MTILINLMLGIWGLIALLMMLVILMQRPKSEGLGAAFGGGVTENIFGAQTTNVLVKFTAWLAGFFFALTFVLSILYAHKSMGESSLSRELKKTAPAAQSSPAAGTKVSPAPSSAAAVSPAPDSGVGVLPPGSASVAPISPSAPATRISPGPPAASPAKKNPTP